MGRRRINRIAKAELERDRIKARKHELRLDRNHREHLVDNILRSIFGG